MKYAIERRPLFPWADSLQHATRWLLCRRQDSHSPNSSRCMYADSWGDVPEEDRQENEYSLKHGFRLLSSYRTKANETIWVLTESDRSVTTLVLPSEH